MRFAEFSRYLEKLESTPSRLEITKILSELLEKLGPSEIAQGVFLSLGTLGPGYERLEFGISEKLLVKIMARAFSIGADEVMRLFKQKGDLGEVAQSLGSEIKNQKSKIKVEEVFDRLLEIAGAGGTGSQERKIVLLSNLIKELNPVSRRFVVRVPLGTMRLGFSEKTVLEALSLLESGEKEVSFAKGSKSREIKAALEAKYNVFPNIGEMAKVFRAKGPKGLKEVQMRVGVPISPQLCARVETVEEMLAKVGGKGGEVAAEYKYDGVRLQVHLDRSAQNQKSKIKNQNLAPEGFTDGTVEDQRVRMFTRNLEQMQAMFPDLVAAVWTGVRAQSVILDGEAVGFSPKSGKFLPFQETMRRKRKYDVEEMAAKIPVKYFAFDILYKDGQDLTDWPRRERRKVLLETLGLKKGPTLTRSDLDKLRVVATEELVTGESQKLQDYFQEAKSKGLEGLIVKKLDGTYEAGSRGFNWVKFKREETGGLEDTIDGVVLGYYKGEGKRTGFGIGAFLVGIYDEDREKFLTLAKIGTGLTDDEWKKMKTEIGKWKMENLAENVDVAKELRPDVICQPKIVVVIRADEITVSPLHSSGYALRFPRMMAYRSDKSPRQSTSLKEVEQLFRRQRKKLKIL